MDSGHLRFVIWVSASSGIAAITATNFPQLLSQDLNDNFGSIFPAIPFAALLSVLFALRWNDLHDTLLMEGQLDTEVPTRIVGVCLVASLVVLRGITGNWVETAGVALVATFYGMSLLMNPLTNRIVLPYAAIYSVGIAAPSVLEWGFGAPLVSISTVSSAKIVSLLGLPVTWDGSQFSLISRAGGLVSGTVTAGCSSVISITTFLGLLALMHLDLRKDLSSTAKVAIVGVTVLVFLNAVRIAGLIWIGYVGGANALWSIHNWLGYAFFIGFYLAALLVYSRMGKRSRVGLSSPGNRSWFHL
ncbi:MAG: exosortase/archaeosortase family protein [Nitrososphaerota archaeon]|nr:exosortase/archaeosortase family protein [Nitrososphaerota archaeon]MDG6922210.1 exosortase/archaeosortase family protein [Nitrososphaerota archaeon]